MPRNPKYPLEPLREHRHRTVDAATARLGDAVRTREAAIEAKRSADEERSEAEARAATLRSEEAARLQNGELRVADLALADAWDHAAKAQLADLGLAAARAQGQLAVAEAGEGEARAELAQKKADLEVVAKDEARFDDRARRARDAVEEESAEEAFAARRKDG